MIGLGNPGRDYESTRHNVGFWFVDRLAAQNGQGFKKAFLRPWESCSFLHGPHRVSLVKPLTYMNRSGEVLEAQAEWRPGDDRLVVVCCDQMDLPPGQLRLKKQGGTAGHNGLKSIHQAIGAQFCPLYLGIGRPQGEIPVIDHVLGPPSPEERALIDAALERGKELLPILLGQGLDAAMNALNRRDEASKPA